MAKIANTFRRIVTDKKVPAGRLQQPQIRQEIEKLAYQFFVERGCEHGHDQEDWLRAESTVKGRLS